jgi:hypothetical protein
MGVRRQVRCNLALWLLIGGAAPGRLTGGRRGKMASKQKAEKTSIVIEELEGRRTPGFIWKPPSGA